MMNPIPPSAPQYVSASDIATLAGVRRAAVSNWRRRREDFPSPVPGVGSTAKPLFDDAEVRAWLKAQGYDIAKASYTDVLWNLMNGLRGALPPADSAALIVTLIAARNADPKAWEAAELGSAADATAVIAASGITVPDGVAPLLETEAAGIDWRSLLSAIGALPLAELGSIADEMLIRAHASRAFDWLVPSDATKVIVAAAGKLPRRPTVYDPACGLAWTAGELLANASQGSAVLAELNSHVAQVAHHRLALHGLCAEVSSGDSLKQDPAPALRADIAVCVPPFGLRWDAKAAVSDPRWIFGVPAPNRSELAWVQDAIAHLAEDGLGLVLTPMGVLTAIGRTVQEIRARLVREGSVQAVIALPGGMAAGTRIETALWILRPRGAGDDEVLFLDASTMPLEEILEGIHGWHDGGFPLPERAVRIPRGEAAEGDAVLAPSRWLSQLDLRTPEAAEEVVEQRRQQLQQTLEKLRSLDLPDLTLPKDVSGRVSSVKELRAAGALDVTRGVRIDRDAQQLSVGDLRAVRLPDHGLEPTSKGVTASGDVVVSTTGTLLTRVDETGGHQLGSHLIALTPSSDSLDPEFLALCLAAEPNKMRMGGTGAPRVAVNDLHLPVPPISAQRQVAEKVRSLRQLNDVLPGLADELIAALGEAVWAHALT